MTRVWTWLAMLVVLALPALAAAQETPAAAGPAVAAVNINTATQQQLEELPGIGVQTAIRIIEFRQKNGPFRKVEELMNVKGIGEKSFLKLKPRLTVGTPKPAGEQP